MTQRVIISLPEGGPHTVQVDKVDAKRPEQVIESHTLRPGEHVDTYVWADAQLIVREVR